jgi:hypothetical protein
MMMNRILTPLVLAVSLITSASAKDIKYTATSNNRDPLSFELVNGHSISKITDIYFAPSDRPKSPWQSGKVEPVAPGMTLPLRVNWPETCVYDLKIKFDDGFEGVFEKIDLCKPGTRLVAS